LLDIEHVDQNMNQYEKATLVSEITIPSEKTTYWCSLHQGPELDKKHHVVAVSLLKIFQFRRNSIIGSVSHWD